MLPQTHQTELPVSPAEISRMLAAANPFGRREAFTLFKSLSPRRRLLPFEAARLLATCDPMVWEAAAVLARAVREEVFGRRIALPREKGVSPAAAGERRAARAYRSGLHRRGPAGDLPGDGNAHSSRERGPHARRRLADAQG